MNGGSVPASRPAATSSSDRYGMPVLLGVRPDAVSVLEVDAEVLDRLARQLVDDAAANGLGQRALVRRQSERRCERRRVWRVLIEHGARDHADSCSGVGLEEVRTAVDAVDGLPVAGFTRIGAAGSEVGPAGVPRGQASATADRAIGRSVVLVWCVA